jgi:preprotein translocase SecE subunit
MALLSYIKETSHEIALVKWPTTRKTVVFTLLVVVFTLAMAYILGFVDIGFLKGIQFIRGLVKA